MENVFNSRRMEPYLYSCNRIITKVNKEFIDFIGFTMDELLGKSLIEIGDMLKINSQILLDNISGKYSGYIFTKFLESREVDISLIHGTEANEKVYTFVEKLNARLNDKLIFVEQAFIDNLSGVAVYSVPDLILLKVNQRYLNCMESPFNKEESSLGRPIREIVTRFVGSQAEVIWNVVLETQKASYIKEFPFDNSNKDITYWDCTKIPVFENGKMKYIFETGIEVTERVLNNQSLERQNKIIQQQKEQLEQQNTQLISIIENLSEGVTIADNNGKFIIVNPEAKRLLYQSDNLIVLGDAFKIAKLFDMKGNEILFENFPAIRALRGERVENAKVFLKHPNKGYFVEVSSIPIYNTFGDLTMVVTCFHDITETIEQSRKIEEQKEAIRSRYEFLNRMVDTFDLPVVRLSCPDLKIVDINKKAFSNIKLLRPDIKSIKQIINKKIEDLVEKLKISEYYQYINEVIKEKKTKYLNKKNHIVNGNDIYLNVIFEPILDVNGEIEEILILLIDVTAEIKSNIVMEEALKAQEEFFANISHELKTPLNVICATAQLFSLYCNSGSLDERKNSIIKYIDSIKQNSYRLSKLINNIVDLSKIEAGFFELHISNNNIVEVVEGIVMSVTNLTDSKGLNIIFDTDIEEKFIACDPEKIERIVLNLISNAIKFSEVGDEIFVDINNKNEFVEISIKDNGIGIEAKDLNMIFDRFKQVEQSLSRNAEGTGIGLSLVKSIAELHGGSIYVESELGKGSKFTVVLPSKKVLNENILYNNEVKSRNQNIRVELSDLYL